MLLINCLLIAVIICGGLVSTISDYKNNIIPNDIVILCIFVSLGGEIAYNTVVGISLLPAYLLNIFVAFIISIGMYNLHIWAGGDAKLFFALSMAIPPNRLLEPSFLTETWIFIACFSTAFLYLLFESLFLLIGRRSNSVRNLYSKDILTRRLTSAGPYIVVVMAFQFVLRLAFADNYYNYPTVFLMISIFFVFIVYRLTFLLRPVCVTISTVLCLTSILQMLKDSNGKITLLYFLIPVIIILMRCFISKYNYVEINSEDVKRGMVLSYGTVLRFSRSKVKGLPQYTSEDISSRITQDEADSIVRWSKSKNGSKSIIIMRKMPFAVFIFLGYLLYLIGSTFQW